MINSQTVEYCGIKIPNMNRVFHYVVGKVISLTVFITSSNPSSGHPHGKTTTMVVATMAIFGKLALRIDRTTEFAATNHKGILEHASHLKITHQCGSRLINILTL